MECNMFHSEWICILSIAAGSFPSGFQTSLKYGVARQCLIEQISGVDRYNCILKNRISYFKKM